MSFFKFITSKTFFIQIGLAIVALFVIGFLVLQWLKITTNHGEFVVVPDLSQKSLRLAKEQAENKLLRIEVLDSTEYNPEAPRFSILEQSPAAGRKVKEGRKIYVRINPSGYRKISIPQIHEVTKRNAEAILKAVGLKVGEIIYVDDIGKDMVLGALHKGDTIYSGDKLPKTSVVDLICGNGVNPDAYNYVNDTVVVDTTRIYQTIEENSTIPTQNP